MPQEEQTYNIHYQAEVIEQLLDKIHDLGNASGEEAGLMSVADKTKLDGIASGAQVNVLEGVKLGDTALTPTEKVVTIPVDSTPTASSNNPISSGGVKTALDNLNAGVMTFAGNLVDTRSAGTPQGPYAFRQSGGDGVNYMVRIKGRTIAWNQMIQTVSKTLSPGDGYQTVLSFNIIANHSYYLYIKASRASVEDDAFQAYLSGVITSYNLLGGGTIYEQIIKPTSSGSQGLYLQAYPTQQSDVLFTFQLVDISLLDSDIVGQSQPETLANYKRLYPAIYPYSASVLKNNAATGLETTGFNQWDEEWETGYIDVTTGNLVNSTTYRRSKNAIKILPSTNYYLKGTNSRLCFYDAAGGYISYLSSQTNMIFSTPANACLMRFYSENANVEVGAVCINISDASRNGTYEPYWKRTLALGLNSIACHDENNNAVVVNGLDGVGTSQDEAVVENGMVTKIIKRFDEVDLGSLGWVRNTLYDNPYFEATITGIKANASASNLANIVCPKYATREAGSSSGVTGIAQYDVKVRVFDSAYSDAPTFTTAMSGVKLRYELATPKVLTVDTPFPALIEVDNLGTEKRLPEDTADNPQGGFESDSNYSVSTANLLRKLNS